MSEWLQQLVTATLLSRVTLADKFLSFILNILEPDREPIQGFKFLPTLRRI